MMMNRGIVALACVWIAAAPAAAQDLSRPDTAAQRSGRLFTRRDLLIAGAFAAGAAAMFPVDHTLANHLQDSTVQANHFLSHTATGARLLGSPGALVLPVATFAAGRVLRKPQMADLGLHTAESVLMAQAITSVAKAATGRARPVEDPGHPFNYRFGRGLRNDRFSSMPSGHTSSAFAAASAAASEVGEHWPRHRTLAGITLYSAASLVGLSRMYNNKHWASDVVVGAAVGTFSGWKVVGYTHSHRNNRLDRFLLGTRVAPAPGGGMALDWSSLRR
ncbi:MAG TPA: phosphatase PAP2 family protein [Longimicrobium sp.]|nr:phosphatase PAP2 family protein [Longimicrobium sp.]